MKQMKLPIFSLSITALLCGTILQLIIVSTAVSQDPRAKGLTKAEYYNKYLAPERGLKPLQKPATQVDRKLSTLNVGNVWAKISNAATLGYDRWGTCWEYPARSGITYRWTMAPMIAALKKDSAGNFQKSVAVGTRGAARKSEEEFQPLPGYDSKKYDEAANIGIAFSDMPVSWPDHWPLYSELPSYAKKIPYVLPPVDSVTGFPGVNNGKIAATREAYFAVTDNVPGEGNIPLPLDVRVDLWGLQYDDVLNRNFIIFREVFTNVGTDTLKNVYIGIHDDPDCPEQGSAEWTDDYAAFIAQGTTGIPGYTAREDTLLWNFTYLWDGDDKVEGLIAKNVGWVGLKFLETPNRTGTSIPMGVSTFQVFEYSAAPQGDDKEYDQMAAGIMAPKNVTPHAGDWTQTPNSYGPDITYVVASGPFILAPGQSLPFAFASIHGSNKKDLFNSAILCQLLYNAHYSSAEPPPEPKVTAVSGDKSVTLYWDSGPESGIYRRSDGTVDHVNDRLTYTNAFEGYKVYKSSARGITWGNPIIDFQGVNKGTIPLKQYDLKNDTTGESKHPLGRYFYLGEDTGLKHMFVDNNVNNGYEYWYAVCAYDHDDGPIPPLENSIKSDPERPNDNTVAVVPQAQPEAKTMGSVPNGAVHSAGRSTIQSIPIKVIDPFVVAPDSFRISLKKISSDVKYYSIRNLTTGRDVVSISRDTLKDMRFFSELADNNPVFNGMTLFMKDTTNGVTLARQTNPANTKRMKFTSAQFPSPDSRGAEEDYLIEFTSDSMWTSVAGMGGHKQLFKVPFKVINRSRNNLQVVATVENPANTKDFSLLRGDKISILDIPYRAGDITLDTSVTIDTTTNIFKKGVKATLANYAVTVQFDTTSQFVTGDVFTLETVKRLSDDDTYSFTPVATTERTMTASNLNAITVVPNPYLVSSPYEQGKFGAQKQLQFQRLPSNCTIRIYTIAGDLVKTIYHSGGSIERWNLQTYNEQEIAFGVYLFHVDAPGIGSYLGKFAVIK
jgi:hypothetical protein